MKKMLLATWAAVWAAGGITVAFAGQPVVVKLPVSFQIFDSCSDEYVQLIGTGIVSTSFSTNNNTYHMLMNISEHLDGIGQTTNARYVVNLDLRSEENGAFAGYPVERDIILNEHLIAQGSIKNAALKATGHITVNADGTVTVQRTSLELTCPG